ncbi:MAG: hypothetical protein ACI9J2_002524 [Saprospiraceae bacterium]|jgi:hypothetical protein
MNNLLTKSLFSLFVLSLSIHTIPSFSQSVIKKCQDSNGKWHYGQHASVNCVSAVDSIRQDGVAVAEPVVNEPKKEKEDPELPTEFELQLAENDKAILLRYSSPQAIVAEESRKLSEVQSQLDVLKTLTTKLEKDIAYYDDKEPTDAVIEQLTQRQNVLLKYLNQEQGYADKHNLIISEYVSIKSNFKDATQRRFEAQ